MGVGAARRPTGSGAFRLRVLSATGIQAEARLPFAGLHHAPADSALGRAAAALQRAGLLSAPAGRRSPPGSSLSDWRPSCQRRRRPPRSCWPPMTRSGSTSRAAPCLASSPRAASGGAAGRADGLATRSNPGCRLSAGAGRAATVCFPVQLPISPRIFEIVSLFLEPQVIALHAEHPLAAMEGLSLEHLPGLDRIGQDGQPSDPRGPGWGTAQRVPIEEQLERVALGLGYAILPKGTARFYHRRDIRYLPVAGLDEVQVALAQHKARPMPEFDRFARIARRLLGEVA